MVEKRSRSSRRRSRRRTVREDKRPAATTDADEQNQRASVGVMEAPERRAPVAARELPADSHPYDPNGAAPPADVTEVEATTELTHRPPQRTGGGEAAVHPRPRRRGRRGGRKRSRAPAEVSAKDALETAPAEPKPAAKSARARRGRRKVRAKKLGPSPREEAPPPPEPQVGKARREGPTLRQGAPDKLSTRGLTMLINVADVDECRIAIMEGEQLQELYMERASAGSHVGNIYKAVVTNVEPSIQAAFVDFGMGKTSKNGFLHISDLHPKYFPDYKGKPEEVGRKTPRRERPPIQRCLRRNQEVIVQITKEGIGTKGPTLTTYLSLPGRYLVMMPGMDRLGVSRKIEDEQTRRRLRELLGELRLPKDMGFIIRTAGIDRPKRDLQQDLNYLTRLWKAVEERIQSEKAPTELYRESDLVIRTIRDVLTGEIELVLVDDRATAERVAEFLAVASPKATDRVMHYNGREPLFHKYGIEEEIKKIHARVVPLSSGGSLVIDATEALVAIDVNSGKFRTLSNAEETAYKINVEAAPEIARQLRLRDLGGVIICDFIDMRSEKHKREVERGLREALKKHKERAKILRMSRFGIIEMTRQRSRPSVQRSIYQDCPHCGGSGMIKSAESMALDVMRLLQLGANRQGIHHLKVYVAPQVADYLINRRRRTISQLEDDTGRKVEIHTDSRLGVEQVRFVCTDARGCQVPFLEAEPPEAGPSNRPIGARYG